MSGYVRNDGEISAKAAAFDKLRHRPSDKLRHRPSTSSGTGLRQAQAAVVRICAKHLLKKKRIILLQPFEQRIGINLLSEKRFERITGLLKPLKDRFMSKRFHLQPFPDLLP